MVKRKSMRVKRTSKESIKGVDRFTSLPDDLIYHIYSLLDTKSMVESSLLSRDWRNIWKSDPHLKLKSSLSTGYKNPNFVHRFLSNRDKIAELPTIDFRSNSIPLRLLKKIITYANSHKTHKLNIEYLNCVPTRRGGFDNSLFQSHFLQDLCLNIDFLLKKTPNLTWNLPALTTLHLKRVTFTLCPRDDDDITSSKSLELFSTLSNLKTLVLDDCRLLNIHTFYITSSRLEALSLNSLHHSCDKFVISTPKLLSFKYEYMAPCLLLANNLDSLETATFGTFFEMSMEDEQKHVDLIINTFRQLYKAKFLTLNAAAFTFLSSNLDLLGSACCPFVRLQTLTVDDLSLTFLLSADILSFFHRGIPDRMVSIEYNQALSTLQAIIRFGSD